MGRGGYKMGKSRVRNFLRLPPPQDRVKLFVPPPFKEWKLYNPPQARKIFWSSLTRGHAYFPSLPPYNMAKTSSYSVKTTPQLFVPPLQNGLNFFRPPFS